MSDEKKQQPREIKRVPHFSDGDVECLRCGKTLHLYYNGGELDFVRCCGLVYRTEHVQTDLVIEEPADDR